jgi:hypothetical protein
MVQSSEVKESQGSVGIFPHLNKTNVIATPRKTSYIPLPVSLRSTLNFSLHLHQSL